MSSVSPLLSVSFVPSSPHSSPLSGFPRKLAVRAQHLAAEVLARLRGPYYSRYSTGGAEQETFGWHFPKEGPSPCEVGVTLSSQEEETCSEKASSLP